MRVVVAGLGSIGMRHSRNLRHLGIEQVVGVDPDAGRRDRFAAEIGGPAFASLAEVLAGGAGLVVVASPNRFHVDQATEAARVGCPMLIEKPLGVARQGIDALRAEVAERRLFVHMGSNWKFHPSFRTMKAVLDEGRLGRVTAIQVLAGQWLPDWHPWEDYRNGYSARADLGGGVVLDNHEFDYMTWLLGEVAQLIGFTHHSGALETSTEDVAVACLRFASGVLGTVQMDYIQRESRRRYHLSGDGGTMEWDLRKGVVSVYDAATKETRDIPAADEDINRMYVEQMRHVLDGARGLCAPLTPLDHAIRVLDLQLTLKGDRG